ncbi:DUF6289 family protein [Caulobacter sp. RHG1]|uniref:DUF6289 family protein n=1 Tax=Caulobacter sp. (strain RHG1) TaxID=2545762 RepID=UPI00155522A7|nr:DUF6289 family protein [Caulobacter sp. RHG1]NQE62726.1 hypothetical protein [Caulobacter sp. RHG1]
MKLGKLVLVSAAISAMVVPTMVSAVPINYIETTFYSDATKTVVVGGHITPCVSYPYAWGERTPYYDIYSESCQIDHPEL